MDTLCRIESAKHVAPVLDRVLSRHDLSRRDRSFLTKVVYGVLRHQGYLDWVIRQKTQQPLSKLSLRLRNLLRIGSYQILFLSKVPHSAAVNESVKMAQSIGGKRIAGFVNAVLRGIARTETFEWPDPKTDPVSYIVARHSHPHWLAKRWIDRYDLGRTIKLCEFNNDEAPFTIRTNTTLVTPERLKETLEIEGLKTERCLISPVGLKLTFPESESGPSLTHLECYRRGWFYVQDEAAQLIGLIVDPKPKERILDICAAPGGKASHLAELMGNRGEIIAIDISKTRLKRMEENINRLHLNIIKARYGDATQDLSLLLGPASFDRILIDASCSGLGVLRRNPEGKWKKKEKIIEEFALRQGKILHQAAPLLKNGGILVYSTCTTEPEENDCVVETFRKTHPSFRIEDLRRFLPQRTGGMVTHEGIFNTLFNPFQMDHFYAARMVKDL